jgi:rubrerythrin
MGWEQLKEIQKEQEKENAKPQDKSVCPDCAFPVRENENRELLCPICGWRGNK